MTTYTIELTRDQVSTIVGKALAQIIQASPEAVESLSKKPRTTRVWPGRFEVILKICKSRGHTAKQIWAALQKDKRFKEIPFGTVTASMNHLLERTKQVVRVDQSGREFIYRTKKGV